MAGVFGQRSLQRERQLQCFRLYQENAFAYACVEALQNSLVETGFVLKRGEDEPLEEFQKFVDYHYGKFARDCLQSILLYGFVAWDTKETPKNQIVPFVIPGTHAVIHVNFGDRGEAMYTAMCTLTGKQAHGLVILDEPDLITMKIESAFSKIIPYHIFETIIVQNAIQADKRAAETPLVLENLSSLSNPWALDDFGGEVDPDEPDSTWRSLGNVHKKRVGTISETMIRLQDHYVKSLNTIGHLDSIHQSALYHKKTEESLPKMQLPPQTRVARVDFPSTRQDLKEILRLNAHRICVCLGCPTKLSSATSPSASTAARLRTLSRIGFAVSKTN